MEDLGNDSLGLARATITWRETTEDGDAKELSSAEIPVKEMCSFCFHLAGESHCTDILVNGVSEYDYLRQRRGDQGNDTIGVATVEFEWLDGMGDREQTVNAVQASHFYNELTGLGCTAIFINQMEAEDYFNAIKGNPK